MNYADERMYMDEKELCGVDWFLRKENEPETVSRLGISRRSIDRMKTDKYIHEKSDGVYYAEECTANGIYYPPMRFQIVKSRKGYRVTWIKIYDKKGDVDKAYTFPGKKTNKRRRIFIDVA